jgi:hypothetical protein
MPNPNYVATGNISPSRFVKVDATADNSVVQADANATILGIASEAGREPPLPSVSTIYAAQSGDNIHVYGESEVCLLELGGTVAAGDFLKSDANGKGVVIATTGTTAQEIGAKALTAGASGEFIRVQVVRQTKTYPALS